MSPKFGTSGLRGLVDDLTPILVGNYTRAFLASAAHGGAVHVGWDLRPSSPAIAAAVMAAARASGVQVVVCGPLPTPALALAAMARGHAAIMVTGSHIPADRNGLKFYVPGGEISKQGEAGILARLKAMPAVQTPNGMVATETGRKALPDLDGTDALQAYAARYLGWLGAQSGAGLQGWRIGVYQHSSVARDVLVQVIEALGATAVPLARSDIFIPVDTEALDPDTRTMLAGWCAEYGLDAVISTDGDGDRPMLCDASGQIIPGDVLGVLTARQIGAQVICTPISSNSMVRQIPEFRTVHLTRIGSPHVIAAMGQALQADPAARVAGFEANGGFLLGFAVTGPGGLLPPLMTRDCLLPILAPMIAARDAGLSLRALAQRLPARFTAADRLQDVDSAAATGWLAQLAGDRAVRAAFFADMPPETGIDITDGLRVQFADGTYVHLRPSGNAPEFRCYTEADSPDRAAALLAHYLRALSAALPG